MVLDKIPTSPFLYVAVNQLSVDSLLAGIAAGQLMNNELRFVETSKLVLNYRVDPSVAESRPRVSSGLPFTPQAKELQSWSNDLTNLPGKHHNREVTALLCVA